MGRGSSKPGQGRVLHPDEAALWRKVTEQVVPVPGRSALADTETFEQEMRQYDLPQVPRPVSSDAVPPDPSHSNAVRRTSNGQPALGAIGARHVRQISRGTLEIDGHLDLHGYRQREAHDALRRFLVQAQARGSRYVIVVTGKGQSRGQRDDRFAEMGEERERGVLRRVVRTWLEDAEFRSLVVSYTTAPRTHGGEGALLVHVRKPNRPRR